MQIIPMRDLKNTVEVERLCAEEQGPIYVTKNGYGRLVVMDIEYYQKTMQEIYEAKLIMEGLRDMVEGKGKDAYNNPQAQGAKRTYLIYRNA